jgi:hypothetical protein
VVTVSVLSVVSGGRGRAAYAGYTIHRTVTRVEFSTRSRQIEDSRGLALVIAQPYTTLAK